MLSFWVVCFFITEKVEVLSTLRWTVELHECFPYVLMAKRLLFVTYYNVQVFLSLTNGCQLNGFYMQHPSNLDMHLIKLHPLSGVNKFCLMNSNYWTTRSASSHSLYLIYSSHYSLSVIVLIKNFLIFVRKKKSKTNRRSLPYLTLGKTSSNIQES